MSASGTAARRFRVSPVVLGLTAFLLLIILPPVIYLIRSSLHETNFDGSFGALKPGQYKGPLEAIYSYRLL